MAFVSQRRIEDVGHQIEEVSRRAADGVGLDVLVQQLIGIELRAQVTTDRNKLYVSAVEGAFRMDVDYAMLVKLYGRSPMLWTGLRMLA